jgi:branched-chain amino acid transport system ATP-binding protein
MQSRRHDYLSGETLKGTKSFHLVEKKLAMVPEGRGVFTRMTIQENLMMGAYTRNDKAGIEADIAKWFDVFPRLKERAQQLAGLYPAASSKCWPWRVH